MQMESLLIENREQHINCNDKDDNSGGGTNVDI